MATLLQTALKVLEILSISLGSGIEALKVAELLRLLIVNVAIGLGFVSW